MIDTDKYIEMWDDHLLGSKGVQDLMNALIAEVKRLREELNYAKVTIDDWDKSGPCVTVYHEGCEYVGMLRLYKDENGKVRFISSAEWEESKVLEESVKSDRRWLIVALFTIAFSVYLLNNVGEWL